MTQAEALTTAIKRAGSEEKLGDAIGYSQHAVWKAKTNAQVSAEMAIKIFVWSGGDIPLSHLRPDLIPSDVRVLIVPREGMQ